MLIAESVRRQFIAILGAVFFVAVPGFGQSRVQVGAQAVIQIQDSAQNDMEQFAVGKLQEALEKAGNTTREPATINLCEVPGTPESYAIHRDQNVMTVTGGDDRGLMYGVLRLAEEVKLGTPIEAVRDETEKSFLARRAFKFNMPLAGRYVSARNVTNNAWFWDLNYWTKFLDELAEDRYNALELWSAAPWGQMENVAKYPEATSLSPEEMQQHIQFFRTLFHMAKVRGLDTYIITWNIDVDPAFARAHGLPPSDQDTPLVRDYVRECIRTALATYPELTGLGTGQGEQMRMMPASERALWIANVYFTAIRESRRKYVPFVLRYWGGTPEGTEKAVAQYTQGPVYLAIKYNGEDAYASPMYHLVNTKWLTQPHHYQFLWHLRNDEVFSFLWGNPEFVRELMENMAQSNPAGYLYGAEESIPGPERFDTPAVQAHQPRAYEFQKQWFLFALWGRLGYNPDESDELWRKYFRLEYGPAGDALYDCTVAGSRIYPLITSFHYNYMNGDWKPEESIGSWNTSVELPRANYRHYELYHNILDYVFNSTIDSNYEDIPQYAAQILAGAQPRRSAASPFDIANDLEQIGREALGAAAIAPPGDNYLNRFQAAQADDEAYGHLALYYATKVRGATELGLFIFSGKADYRNAAVQDLTNALAEWRQLVEITKARYLPREEGSAGPKVHWSAYTGAVENDLAIAQSVQPIVTEAQEWQVSPQSTGSAPGGSTEWKTITLQEQQAFGAAGLFQWRVYSNSLFNTPRVEDAYRPQSPSDRWITAYTWKRVLPSAGEREWVLAVPDSPPGQTTASNPFHVRFNGQSVAPAIDRRLASASRENSGAMFRTGYFVYRLGDQGSVEAELPPGVVPEVAAVVKASAPAIDVSAETAQVDAPLTKIADGVFAMPATTEGPREPAPFGADPDPTASALFHFQLAEPGFYRIQCLTLGRGGAIFTVDDYNYFGPADALSPVHRPPGAVPEEPAQAWQTTSEPWAIPLGTGEHTLRIYMRQPGEQLKDVRLVSPAD